MQEHKTDMQHRSTSIMRCSCKSTYRPPDVVPLRDGDTTPIPCTAIRNGIDSEFYESCGKVGGKAGGIGLCRRGRWGEISGKGDVG